MFEPVIIDLSEVASEFVLSEDEIKSMSRLILSTVADDYVRKWEKLIDNNLHQTRNEYKKGIFSEQPDDYNIIIGLTPRQSNLALMLEDGATSFDIKDGFSKSEKKHEKKDGGWYLTVPFKWATAEALGESAGFSNQMPLPIQQIVKVSKQPLQLGDLPMPYQVKGQNQTSGYNHKFTIYEGLHRQEVGSGDTEKRGGYFTFRRVSDKSDPDSWIHPGFVALGLMEKAYEQVDIGNLVDFAVDNFLGNR